MTAELVLTRDLAFPVERVWRAFTDPAALAAWFWPQRFAPTAAVELRAGGRWRIDGPGAGMAVAGEYVTVEPPHLLVFTWAWDGGGAATLVTIALTVRHSAFGEGPAFTGEKERAEHGQGWSDCLDRLPGWLSSLY
jgi:uncharacterized protein YndB with AHSA1/START domain